MEVGHPFKPKLLFIADKSVPFFILQTNSTFPPVYLCWVSGSIQMYLYLISQLKARKLVIL